MYRNKIIGRNGLIEAELGIVYMLRQSFKKKSLIIDDWGVIEGAAGTGGRRARGERDRVERKS